MPQGIGYGPAALKDYLAKSKRLGKKASSTVKSRIMSGPKKKKRRMEDPGDHEFR